MISQHLYSRGVNYISYIIQNFISLTNNGANDAQNNVCQPARSINLEVEKLPDFADLKAYEKRLT